MKTQLIRSSLYVACLMSFNSHAGFFDALNDAAKTLETIEKVIEEPTQKEEISQKSQDKAKNNQPQKTASAQKSQPKQRTISTTLSTTNSSGFINYSSGRIKLPYDQCPTTDILGIHLGQNISEIMPNSPFYFRRPQDSDSPTFKDESSTNGFEVITVFSPKFESMRLDSINRKYHYGFDKNEYNKIKDLDKQASRHGLNVWIDAKKGKNHPLIKEKHAQYINLLLDVNGDISSISVQRTLPIKISESEVENKLRAKYGEKINKKDKNGQVIYLSTWGARVERGTASIIARTPSEAMTEQSIINYQLSCEVVKRASKAHHKKLRNQWKELAESMRDNSGASVDI